jgi:hypothetical protein
MRVGKKSGQAIGLLPPLPNTRELAEKLFFSGGHVDPSDASNVGVILWSYWSGVTHSKWYALRQGIEEAGDLLDAAVPGVTAANFVTRSRDVHQSFAVSALGYIPACGTLHSLMGWDEPVRMEAAEDVLYFIRQLYPSPPQP